MYDDTIQYNTRALLRDNGLYSLSYTKVSEQTITQALLIVLHTSNQQYETLRVLLPLEGIAHVWAPTIRIATQYSQWVSDLFYQWDCTKMPILLICYHHAYVEQTTLFYYLHATSHSYHQLQPCMAQDLKEVCGSDSINNLYLFLENFVSSFQHSFLH